MAEIFHPIISPHNIVVFVGGCRRRGEGSRFRAKAHAHRNERVICYLSTKWLDNKFIAIHELAHVIAPGGHIDKWREKVLELGGTLDEIPGIMKNYHKKARGK